MFREMRRFKQQVSKEECERILDTEKRGVLSVHGEDGYPYAIPVDFYYDREDGRVYIHGAKQGHKIDAIRADDRVCFTVWDQGYLKEGVWGYHSTSVVIFGRAELITDIAKTTDKCRKLGFKYFPTAEFVEKEMKYVPEVCMIAITPDHMTGKLVHEQ
ncbi:MAG: pyridoxamine 5'-phosphate oxidase family protein [Lachnospiraceae bacterium]|nr:pyridoxamine 5'-phosphate oxidase family protein [Lachnospiraceae bacterium]